MVTPNEVPEASSEERLRVLIERISAYIEHFHGGSVEMISFDGKVVKVQLGGACLGGWRALCASSSQISASNRSPESINNKLLTAAKLVGRCQQFISK